MPQPVMLIIRDGWGINPRGKELAKADGNATLLARTPFHDRLYHDYPWSRLSASGMDVGLPDGQMGNSEVGHLNIGAGRIVYQDFTRIDRAIADGEFAANPALTGAVAAAKAAGSCVHVLGLLSPGGVHSHERQIAAMVDLAAAGGAPRIAVHAFLDGRDTPPKSAAASLAFMAGRCAKHAGARIASICGRYYAMDRDKRWERLALAYDLIVNSVAPFRAATAESALKAAYERGETDEFVQPTVIADGEARP